MKKNPNQEISDNNQIDNPIFINENVIQTNKFLKIKYTKNFDGIACSKNDLILLIAEQEKITIYKAKEIITSIFDSIQYALMQEEEVSIAHFGKFEIKESKVREAYNPVTKQNIQLPIMNLIKFNPAKALKQLVDPNHQKSIQIIENSQANNSQIKGGTILNIFKKPTNKSDQPNVELKENKILCEQRPNLNLTMEAKNKQPIMVEKVIETQVIDYLTEPVIRNNPIEVINELNDDLYNHKNVAIKQTNYHLNYDQPHQNEVLTMNKLEIHINEPELNLDRFKNEPEEHLEFAQDLYKYKSKFGAKQRNRNFYLGLSISLLIFVIFIPLLFKIIVALIGPYQEPISLDLTLIHTIGSASNYLDYVANLFILINIPIFGIIFLSYLVYYLLKFSSQTVQRIDLTNYKTKQAFQDMEIITKLTNNAKSNKAMSSKDEITKK